jgi:hypothetical protein
MCVIKITISAEQMTARLKISEDKTAVRVVALHIKLFNLLRQQAYF